MRNAEGRLLKAVAELLQRVASGEVNSTAAAVCIENALDGRETNLTAQHGLLAEPIINLGLFSVRTRNLFRRMKLQTIGELVALTPDNLLALRDCSVTSLNEIRERLREKDLRLRGDYY